MSGRNGRWWRRAIVPALVAAGIAVAAPSLAQATAITEFSSGLSAGDSPAAPVPGPDGNVWFLDSHSIGRITPSGAISLFTKGLNPGSAPIDLVAGSDGNLWFSDDGTTKAIGRITPSGTITEYGTADGLNPGAAPQNVVLGPDGNVWFVDTGTMKAVGRITPSGKITEFGTANGLDSNSQINDITAGPDGNLWFTDQGDPKAIGRVATAGTAAGTIKEFVGDLDPIDSFPDEITAGADGNVWFTDSNEPALGRTTPRGVTTEFKTVLQPNADPDTITTGPDGNIWFADQYANQREIGRVTPAGTITEFDTGLNTKLPDDLTVGADGNVWVAQSDMAPLSLSVARVSPAGVISEFSNSAITSPGSDTDQIVAGPDGNLWFTDDFNDSGMTGGAIGKVSLQIPPTASTSAASDVTGTTAKVSGSVNPLGTATTVTFDYGTTSNLGAKMTAETLAASGSPSTVTGTLSTLAARTVIYYRVVATSAFGTATGAVQTFTTGAAAPPGSSTRSTTATFGNQQITLTTPSLTSCTAKTTSLGVRLSSTAIRHSRATKLHFVTAAFYLDKGVRHVRKRTTRLRNGKRTTVKTIVYTANAVAHHVPVKLRLRLAGLRSGSHTLKVRLTYRETVTKHRHQRTVTVTRTLTAKFRVC